jgi:NAD(P)-dependent dehydrogenase (short-subunit alcohol dehydrogenase family)
MAETALIVGTGAGLSASLARLFHKEGMRVALAARRTDKLAALCTETSARAYACDATKPAEVEKLFADIVKDIGTPDLVVYNPSGRARGPIADLKPDEVLNAIMVGCYGGFLVGQQAARLMLKAGHGSILFTGASASVKGFPLSAAFAMGKFGLRGLTQSMARELAPQNIHVAHFVIDGGIRQPNDTRGNDRGPDGLLEPDAIAANYLAVHRQHRSAWTDEIALRPWVEKY